MSELDLQQPVEPTEPVVVAAPEAAPTRKNPERRVWTALRSSRVGKIGMVLVGIFVVFAVLTSIVYLRPPTDGAVRAIARVLPYPAAFVGSDIITVSEYLKERDALNTYFASSAGETGTMPSEEEITSNIMDTLVQKSAVNRLASEGGVILDEARVNAFYEEALAGADPEEFSSQLQSMFGWTVDEFRARVVRPVVLAMQLSEQISTDASVQEPRKQQAQAAYDRLVAGEEFAVVAGDTSADGSAVTGGDVGYMKMSEIPAEWSETIASLEIGGYSQVMEGSESYLILQVTDRVEAGEDTEVKLSVISVPKVTLDEAVQEYLDSVRVWKLIGRA